jgi:novel protein kinase C epsilon type
LSRDLQKNEKDAMNFDTEFTKEDPVLTPEDEGSEELNCINQEEFRDFSMVNKDFNPARFAAQ